MRTDAACADAAATADPKLRAWTVEFDDATQAGKKTPVLLDHMLYSPNCQEGGKICFITGSGQIEREAFKPHVAKNGKARDDRPSDHFPLSARFALL